MFIKIHWRQKETWIYFSSRSTEWNVWFKKYPTILQKLEATFYQELMLKIIIN